MIRSLTLELSSGVPGRRCELDVVKGRGDGDDAGVYRKSSG